MWLLSSLPSRSVVTAARSSEARSANNVQFKGQESSVSAFRNTVDTMCSPRLSFSIANLIFIFMTRFFVILAGLAFAALSASAQSYTTTWPDYQTSVAATLLVPQGQRIAPTDPAIEYVGRVSMRQPERPTFTFPGVTIRTAFTGTSLRMIAKPRSGYFMAQIDGCPAFKVGFNAERDSIVTLATALPYGQHEVQLMYVTEGYDRRAEFRGFIVDEGCRLAAPKAAPERRIEFIGNSITCGYGVEATEASAPFLDETCNHYHTYAARTARNLGAQHIVVARSGIGVYRNYNGPLTGDSINMNTEYTHTLLYDPSETWDFSRFTPQVVCINLGTNDTSTTGADPVLLKEGYVRLLGQVRGVYPKAKIVFLCGCMMNGDALELARRTMDAVVNETNAAGDREVYRFDFTPQNGSLGYGASWHPSYWQHGKMADELTPFLRDLMKW